MTKQPAAAAKTPLPKTLQRATIGAGVQIALSLLTAGLFWGFTPQLKKLIIDNNAHLKKPLPDCGGDVTKNCLDVIKSLHAFRTGVTEYTVISSLILVFLVFLMRRGSGAGRWIYIIASVFAYQVGFAGSPMSLFVVGTETPTALKVVQVLAGLASIAVIVLLLMPASAAYFRVTGAALRAARGQTQQRPAGLAGLFAPRQPAKRTAPEPDPEPEAGSARPKAKAKVRTDADAVAKGAELARARAKASKSRRPGQ
jgi:hypothetical protein